MRIISMSLMAAMALLMAACDPPQENFVKDNTGNMVPKGSSTYIDLFNPKFEETFARKVASTPRERTDTPDVEKSDGWSNSQRGLQYRYH